jgi:putative methyltransferase (TIGR04325 family)
MYSIIKKVFKNFWAIKNHLEYSGPYKNWEEATLNSIGYSSNIVLNKVETATRNVLNGISKYERDGTNFNQLPEINTLLKHLEILKPFNSKILDIGGGLGSLFINYKPFFDEFKVKYTVLEQENFCDRGQKISKEFSLHIDFKSDISEIDTKEIDIVIMSSTLQYFKEWKKFVYEIISIKPKHIFIDRHPLTNGDSKIFVQLNTNYYDEEVTYPIHIVNEKEFLNTFNNYEVINSWYSDFDPKYFKGFHLSLQEN